MTSRDGERTGMDEERMNETMRQSLAASRRPPEPPLDAMWLQIEERVFGDAKPRLVLHTRASRWLIPTLAAAAALVFGVGLGWYAAPRSVVTRIVASPATATPATQQVASADATASNTENSKSVASTTPSRENARVQNARSVATPDTRDMAAARLASQFNDAGGGSEMSRYLAQTTVLLASLPSDRATTESDTAVATRAGE